MVVGSATEVTASGSHAVLVAEITDLRRICRDLITSGKRALPDLPEGPRAELLAALLNAETEFRPLNKGGGK